MRIKNDELLELLESLGEYFNEDIDQVLKYVKDNGYEHNDNNNFFKLYTYSEYADLFRRHLVPFNKTTLTHNISRISIDECNVILYDFSKKEEVIIPANTIFKIKDLDVRALGKLAF